ncbi:MAG: hypothetical protein HFJ59_02615 [Clostridia bacterium]|nr:hypothetical protein [Clostridia bacterium]
MNKNIEFLENEDYKLVMSLIEQKMGTLKRNEKFNEQYTKLFDVMDEIELLLNNEQKEKFNEIINLFYSLEEYYVAFSYSLGVKYGEYLSEI